MKKIGAVLLATLMLASMAGCGSAGKKPENTASVSGASKVEAAAGTGDGRRG